MQDVIDAAEAIGITTFVIDEDTDFDKLPSLAELFPQSQKPREIGPEHKVAEEIWEYLYNNTTLGEAMYYFDKKSRDQTILDIAYLIRREFKQ